MKKRRAWGVRIETMERGHAEARWKKRQRGCLVRLGKEFAAAKIDQMTLAFRPAQVDAPVLCSRRNENLASRPSRVKEPRCARAGTFLLTDANSGNYKQRRP